MKDDPEKKTGTFKGLIFNNHVAFLLKTQRSILLSRTQVLIFVLIGSDFATSFNFCDLSLLGLISIVVVSSLAIL